MGLKWPCSFFPRTDTRKRETLSAVPPRPFFNEESALLLRATSNRTTDHNRKKRREALLSSKHAMKNKRTLKQAGKRTLSNGQPLPAIDIAANDYVDGKAKAEARAAQPSRRQMWTVVDHARRLTEAALWLGRITALANRFPVDGDTVGD